MKLHLALALLLLPLQLAAAVPCRDGEDESAGCIRGFYEQAAEVKSGEDESEYPSAAPSFGINLCQQYMDNDACVLFPETCIDACKEDEDCSYVTIGNQDFCLYHAPTKSPT